MKPDISDDENDKEDDYGDTKSIKKKNTAQKSKRSPIKAGQVSPCIVSFQADEQREAPRKWTPVEDEIFLKIMSKLVKARMWDAVKEDGRLGYRGAQGIAAHVTAIVRGLHIPTPT